jgi:vacuolar-type H+-ATPase subunit C/Vma6
MPTFNIASYGSLETVIALLKNGKYTANYNDFSNYQHIETEDNINNTQNDNNDS